MKINFEDKTNPGTLGRLYLNGKPICKRCIQFSSELNLVVQKNDIIILYQKPFWRIWVWLLNIFAFLCAIIGVGFGGINNSLKEFRNTKFIRHHKTLLMFKIVDNETDFLLHIIYEDNSSSPFRIIGDQDKIQILLNTTLKKTRYNGN